MFAQELPIVLFCIQIYRSILEAYGDNIIRILRYDFLCAMRIVQGESCGKNISFEECRYTECFRIFCGYDILVCGMMLCYDVFEVLMGYKRLIADHDHDGFELRIVLKTMC